MTDPSRPPSSDKPAPSAEQAPRPAAKVDRVLIHGVSRDRKALAVLRQRDERLEAGTVRALEPGRPIHGEVVRLRPHADQPLVCDVEVEVPAAKSAAGRLPQKGPAQVATEQYRRNWDRIWTRPGKPQLPN